MKVVQRMYVSEIRKKYGRDVVVLDTTSTGPVVKVAVPVTRPEARECAKILGTFVDVSIEIQATGEEP